MKKLLVILALGVFTGTNVQALTISDRLPYKKGSPFAVNPIKIKDGYENAEGSFILNLDKMVFSNRVLDPTIQTSTPYGKWEEDQPRVNMSPGFVSGYAFDAQSMRAYDQGVSCTLRYFDDAYNNLVGRWRGDLVCINLENGLNSGKFIIKNKDIKHWWIDGESVTIAYGKYTVWPFAYSFEDMMR